MLMSIAYSPIVRTQLSAALILLCTGCVDPKVERYQLTTPSTSTAAGPPAILSLTATPGIGTSSERATIGVRLTDAANLPIPNAAVQLSTTAGRLENERLTTSAFTATVTSTGPIPATLDWQWDDTNDGTYEVTVSGANPNSRITTYLTTGPKTIKVRVVDPATNREATSTLTFTVS